MEIKVEITERIVELNQKWRAATKSTSADKSSTEDQTTAVSVVDHMDLIKKRDEWFEIENDIPFWEYAGITEEFYREWVVTTKENNV